jgi:hypothetical protein
MTRAALREVAECFAFLLICAGVILVLGLQDVR